MFDDLRQWLYQHADDLTKATIYRAPSMLPDIEDVKKLLFILADNLGRSREIQHAAIQFWALTDIGRDAHAANDWLTILRVLKDEIGEKLEEDISASDALISWRALDTLFTYALIEATQLASDIDHAALLEHAQSLRTQIQAFETSKSNFVAVAAHEFRTPLTLLEGYANMIRYESEPESRIMLYVDGLSNGFQRMHEIIKDMIDVSLIDLHAVELNYTQLNLERIMLIVADNLDKYFLPRHVELTILPSSEEIRIYADQEKLVNAFRKMLLNALKFTPDGGKVTVSFSVTRLAEAGGDLGGYVDVVVADTGIGINPEDLEMIFAKFTSTMDASLHSSSKTNFKGGGPGLGLPIVRGIVEAHGGRIWADSEKCDEETCPGSTFHIELPIWLEKPLIEGL